MEERKTLLQKIKNNGDTVAIRLGILCAILGVLSPIILLVITGKKIEIALFDGLGPVGDFIGGSSVSLLTLASVLFLIANLIREY